MKGIVVDGVEVTPALAAFVGNYLTEADVVTRARRAKLETVAVLASGVLKKGPGQLTWDGEGEGKSQAAAFWRAAAEAMRRKPRRVA